MRISTPLPLLGFHPRRIPCNAKRLKVTRQEHKETIAPLTPWRRNCNANVDEIWCHEIGGAVKALLLSVRVNVDLHPRTSVARPVVAVRGFDLNWHGATQLVRGQHVKRGNIASKCGCRQAQASKLCTHQVFRYLPSQLIAPSTAHCLVLVRRQPV